MRMWWVLAAMLTAVSVVAIAQHMRGAGGFATHPVSVLALAAGSTAIVALAERAPRRLRPWVVALGLSVGLYLGVGTWASFAAAPVEISLWSSMWMPVTALVTIVGLAGAGARRGAVIVAAIAAAMTLLAALTTEPAAPFAAVPTAGDVRERMPGASDVTAALLVATLAAAALAVTWRSMRAPVTERQQLSTCAVIAANGPGLMLACICVAALENPGDIDPSTGSVGYLVALSAVAVVSAVAALTYARWTVRAIVLTWAASTTVIVGVLLSPFVARNATGGAVAIASVSALALSFAVGALWVWQRWSTAPPLRLVGTVFPELSPRENEVLELVAAGATNAAIAARLFISERTVEQHLRTVFTKLNLGDREDTNRRVRATAVWWQRAGAVTGGDERGLA